jgi:hypothetical protein
MQEPIIKCGRLTLERAPLSGLASPEGFVRLKLERILHIPPNLPRP